MGKLIFTLTFAKQGGQVQALSHLIDYDLQAPTEWIPMQI